MATAGDNEVAVRKGLDFLRFVGREYERKQVYDHFEWDGEDFYTREAEENLANVLRNDRTLKECVEMAQREIAEIEAMEAYDDYCLAFFDNVHEAMDFRLADAARYIEEMDRQIERHSKDYRKDLKDGHFEVFCALGMYNVRISPKWYRCIGLLVPRGAEAWYHSYRSDGTGTKVPIYTLSKGAVRTVPHGTLR